MLIISLNKVLLCLCRRTPKTTLIFDCRFHVFICLEPMIAEKLLKVAKQLVVGAVWWVIDPSRVVHCQKTSATKLRSKVVTFLYGVPKLSPGRAVLS